MRAIDVARYFLALADEEAGDLVSNLKLQKLLYYAQGFHLAMTGRPLFDEPIQAWMHGPVVPAVYHAFKVYGSGPIPVAEAVDENPTATDAETEPPMFSLRYLVSGYSVSDCQPDDKAAFAETLAKLSKLTWAQIKQAPRHGLGCEKIARNAIRGGMPPHLTKDVDLIALRFNGRKAMVGYRDRALYYVLWLDHDFSVDNHGS